VLVVILVLFVLVGGALAVLAYENFAALTTEVHLTLFGWHAPALPLGAWLLLACLLGALPLYIVTVLSALRDRRQMAKLRRRVAELEQLLNAGGEVGKKLDFLLQEMNRETNTILSKTGGLGDLGLTITELALAAKADVDKIREQSLNLE